MGKKVHSVAVNSTIQYLSDERFESAVRRVYEITFRSSSSEGNHMHEFQLLDARNEEIGRVVAEYSIKRDDDVIPPELYVVFIAAKGSQVRRKILMRHAPEKERDWWQIRIRSNLGNWVEIRVEPPSDAAFSGVPRAYFVPITLCIELKELSSKLERGLIELHVVDDPDRVFALPAFLEVIHAPKTPVAAKQRSCTD